MATAVDHNRLSLIIAVLEKRMGMFLQNQDAYQPTRPYDVVFGEIGLTGGVSRIDQRVKEAEKLGFRRVIMPEKSLKGWTHPPGMEIIGVNTVAEALKAALG